MNDNDKNLKANEHAQNCKIPVYTKESIKHSVKPWHNPRPSNDIEGSQLGSKAREKTDLHVTTAMTKRLSYIPAEEGPQIHESRRTVNVKKFCAEKLDTRNAAPKIVRGARSRSKHDKKHSKVLVSDEKSSTSASRKQQSALKSYKDTAVIDSNGNAPKKTLCKTNKKISLPKAKEVPCKTLLYQKKDCHDKRGESYRFASKESGKVIQKLGSIYTKKYLEKANLKEKIKITGKQIDNNANGSKRTKEIEKTNPQKIFEAKKGLRSELTAVCNDNAMNMNFEGNGAARTRIFEYKRISRVDADPTKCKDSIRKGEAGCFKSEFATENPLQAEKQNGDEQEHKISNSTIIPNGGEYDSINSSCDMKDNNIIGLYDRGFITPESNTDCDHYQKFGGTVIELDKEMENQNSSSVASSDTICKKTLSTDTRIYLSQENVSTSNQGTKNEKELVIASTKISEHKCNEIKKSLTVSNEQSVSQDEITYHANLMNHGYHSDQQYCKRSNNEQNKKYIGDKATISTGVDKNQSTLNNDAKYDLIRALIQPVSEIHNSKICDNSIAKLSTSGHRSEDVKTRINEGLENYYINLLGNDRINEKIANVSNGAEQSHDNVDNLEDLETCSPHASAIHIKQPLSNTSDYFAMNSKMKNCKYTKKYRHFKHEEKNMCCYMTRYIKKMVSHERRCQEFEKQEIPEREEVEIIIDENSPKTSKIRIVNDRSSVSVVCHTLGRTSSSDEGKNNAMANMAELSGGESSGYRSFHNNSNTKNLIDPADQIEIRSKKPEETKNSTPIISHNSKSVHGQRYDPPNYDETSAEPFNKKDRAIRSFENICAPTNVGNAVNECGGKIEEAFNPKQNVYDEDHGKLNREMKHSMYDAKNYLSTFTNCIDLYSPCEIMAYQFEERNGSKILQLNNTDRVEKDSDDAELHIGRYLTEKYSDTKDESSEGDSSEELGSVKDLTTAEEEVIMLKEPDNLKSESLEFVVSERFLEEYNPGSRTNSTDIPTTPAQHRIVTSLLNIKPEETVESPEGTTTTSRVKFPMKNNRSASVVKSSNDNIKSFHSSTIFPSLRRVTAEDIYERSTPYGNTCLGKLKIKNKRSNNSNAVHELWTNKKSTIDSTDNESQSSGKTCCGKNGSKKHDKSKFKFNIFRKSKSSASEKTISIPPDQLPKPPPTFLETATPSQSTIFSSTSNTDAPESDIAIKPQALAAPILGRNSSTKPHSTDTAPIHVVRKTHADADTDENTHQLRSRANSSNSIVHKERETNPEPSFVPPLHDRLLVKSEELHAAVPPPASALPPPYPFCCPLVPYMMQYWQNNQLQPPPASTVPLPEANWKPGIDTVGSEPPPPGMIPIPWFSPMMHMNNLPPSGEVDTRMSSTSRAQPTPEWLMMPKGGYAPCLPCNKALESNSGKRDSLSFEDDEPISESSVTKQDGKKKKVSNKLFKIFRRKNRTDMEIVDEDEKKARNRPSRSDGRQNTAQMVQNDPENFDDRSIWESPDIAGIVTPEEIGRCFRRGFRADGLTLSGNDYLCAKAPSDTTSDQEDVFNFSDHDTPLDFLLALGFSVDEATAAIRDDEVRSRFKAALTEARIWVPHIATTQGTLLYLLAMKAKPKVMRYFLQLVESVVNKRITNAVKLDAYLKILEKVEEGFVSFVTLFGKDTGKDDEEDTVIVEKQRRRIFYTIYKYAESEAKEVDRQLTTANVDLLHSLAVRYRPAIGPHLRLLACYIGEGFLTKDVQLEAALIYLSRLDSAYVQLADLEKYCGLPPSERRRAEQFSNTQDGKKV